jgi:dolichyl-phosphate-mannose--protein O-mannosyl transferase
MSISELCIRFIIGGIVVSTFAMLGEVVRPKSFAGLFGAAPSVALASFGLTVAHHGAPYAALEARSMVLGAFAFLLYAVTAKWLLARFQLSALFTTLTAMPVWFGAAFLLVQVLRGAGGAF